MNMEVVSNEVRVKNEPIFDSQSIPDTRKAKRQSMKVKEEPIDIEMNQTSKEIVVKAEEEEEFANKRLIQTVSIAFLNDQTSSTKSIDANPINKKSKNYKCDICKKSFLSYGDLERHKRVHTGERPFECEVCKKGFSQSGGLERHKRTHTGERPFECEMCKRRFTDLANLARHKKIHTGEKPYECEICKKKFSRRYEIERHKRTHKQKLISLMP